MRAPPSARFSPRGRFRNRRRYRNSTSGSRSGGPSGRGSWSCRSRPGSQSCRTPRMRAFAAIIGKRACREAPLPRSLAPHRGGTAALAVIAMDSAATQLKGFPTDRIRFDARAHGGAGERALEPAEALRRQGARRKARRRRFPTFASQVYCSVSSREVRRADVERRRGAAVHRAGEARPRPTAHRKVAPFRIGSLGMKTGSELNPLPSATTVAPRRFGVNGFSNNGMPTP